MRTKFSTLEKVESKKTVFKNFIGIDLELKECDVKPEDWDNVLHLGHDKDYGDVFKVWDDKNKNNFIIIFGEKGDEFNN